MYSFSCVVPSHWIGLTYIYTIRTWHAEVHGVTKSWKGLGDRTTYTIRIHEMMLTFLRTSWERQISPFTLSWPLALVEVPVSWSHPGSPWDPFGEEMKSLANNCMKESSWDMNSSVQLTSDDCNLTRNP